MLRRHRNTRPTRESVSPEAEGLDAETSAGARPARSADTLTAERPRVQRRRREPAPEDHALYSCSCGYVFEADVSTSVGCPHCGGSQAW